MEDSILKSIKKVLGIHENDSSFDIDITMHINGVFSTLNQLGVGPINSFFITGDSETWSDFLGGAKNINPGQTYGYLRVRLIFDPPATSFTIASMEKQAEQLEWRLNIHAEGEADHARDRQLPSPLWNQRYEVGRP